MIFSTGRETHGHSCFSGSALQAVRLMIFHWTDSTCTSHSQKMKITYHNYIYHSFDLHQAEIQDDSCTYTPIKYQYKPHWLHKDLHYLPHTHWALKSMLTIKAFIYPACLMERPWPYSKQHCSYLEYILTSSWSVYSLIFEQMKRYVIKNFRILK